MRAGAHSPIRLVCFGSDRHICDVCYCCRSAWNNEIAAKVDNGFAMDWDCGCSSGLDLLGCLSLKLGFLGSCHGKRAFDESGMVQSELKDILIGGSLQRN